MTGDINDILNRLKAYTPRGWFGDWAEAPIVTALLTGIASVFNVIYLLILFFRAQTRLDSSNGGWVDLWASDFLGNTLPRKPNESDASYIARIKIAIFQQKATRPAMESVLTQLTGRTPIIFEPARPLDSGCMGAPLSPGYCGVARMGSIAAPFTCLITVFRPRVTGGSAGAAYCNAITRSAMNASPSLSYTGSLSQEISAATDEDIIAAILATKPIATNIGVAITN